MEAVHLSQFPNKFTRKHAKLGITYNIQIIQRRTYGECTAFCSSKVIMEIARRQRQLQR